MPANRPNEAEQLAAEREAWKLRAEGLTISAIAPRIGRSVSGTHKLLRRVETRELKRLTANVTLVKVRQHSQLDYIIAEALEAWRKSKTPLKRASRKRSSTQLIPPKGDGETPKLDPGDEVETWETTERDGNTGFLHTAMNAMDRQRSLWGLDVAAAVQESTTTVAEMVSKLAEREAAYDRRKLEEQGQVGHPPDDAGAPGGTPPAVQAGSEPVQ